MKRVPDELLKAEISDSTLKFVSRYDRSVESMAAELLIYRDLERRVSASCEHRSGSVQAWCKLAMQELQAKFKEAGLDP